MADPRREASETPPAAIQAQAEVSAEDVERARVAAQRDGSALLNAMLNATEQQP